MADTTKNTDEQEVFTPSTPIPQASNLDGEIHHVNNPVVLDPPSIEKKYLGAVTGYTKHDNCLFFTDGRAKVEIKIFSDEIIRIRLAPEGVFLADFSYAIVDIPSCLISYEIKESPENYKVVTAKTICTIEKSTFRVSFEDPDEQTIVQDYKPMHWEENADCGGYYVYCTKSARENDVFFGLGDKASKLNLRGLRVRNWNSDTYSYAFNQDPLYKTIPFYLSVTNGKAYGIFFDNTFKTYFDFAAEQHDQTSFWSEGGELQYYYIQGPELIDVTRRYHQITGTHYLPPLWALGYHQCRWSYYPEKVVRDVTSEFRKRKIPCDAIYLDIDYMDGYRCFTWNSTYFPNPKKMIDDLAADGFKTVAMIDPGIKVDENYWVYQQGKANNFFCRRGDDYFMEGYVWPGRCRFPDYTNPEVREWWGGLYKGLIDDGVAGFWNDMNEPALFGRGTFPYDVRHDFDGHSGSHRKAHNIYGMQMVRATYDGLKKLYGNKRPFTITRAAYSGVQRYSSVWTGDNIASWEHLHIGILQLQRLSVSGLSFCGTDIGGFTGNPDGELYTRWMQFGVFSPFMRVHSAGDTRDREPWSFGSEWEVICKKFIELRYKLLPYIYTSFWQQHKFGDPILRPIAMLEQHIPQNLQRESEFAFGDHLLISAVESPGQKTKIVYLPKGVWYYYFDNSTYVGEQEHEIATPLDEMPIFIRGGSIIPEFPVMQHTFEVKIKQLQLNFFFAEGRYDSYLYDDQGDSFEYQDQQYAFKHFISEISADSFKLSQLEQGLYQPYYTAYKLYFVGFPSNLKEVSVDGVLVPIEEDNTGYFIQVDSRFKKIVFGS